MPPSTTDVHIECSQGIDGITDDVIALLCAYSSGWNAAIFRAALKSSEDPDRWPLLMKAFDRETGLVGLVGAVDRTLIGPDRSAIPAYQLGFGAVAPSFRGSDVFPRLAQQCMDTLAAQAPPGAIAYGFSNRVKDYCSMLDGVLIEEEEASAPLDHLPRTAAPLEIRVLDLDDADNRRQARRIYERESRRHWGTLRRTDRMWESAYSWSRESRDHCIGAWAEGRLVAYFRVKFKAEGIVRICEAFSLQPGSEPWFAMLGYLAGRLESSTVAVFASGSSHPLMRALHEIGMKGDRVARFGACPLGAESPIGLLRAADNVDAFYFPHADRL